MATRAHRASEGRTRIGRPYRQLRRWARYTPNGTIALNLICAGIVLVLGAVIIALVAL